MAKQPKPDITLVPTYNVNLLGVADITEYPANWNISGESLQITAPGFNPITVPFDSKSANYYKSNQLNITCDEDDECTSLPDGVYKIKYSFFPNTKYVVEKSFMRVEQIKRDYEEKYAKLDFSQECSKEDKLKDKRYLLRIKELVEGSVAAVNQYDLDKAYKWYNKAKQLLNNFYKDGCGC